MVKIGKAFVSLDSVEAVAPIKGETGYAIFLISGHIVRLHDVTEADVVTALTCGGMLDPPCEPPPKSFRSLCLALTVDELAELRDVLDSGYQFVAKDANGQVFAYSRAPRKGQSSWINDDVASRVKKLRHGVYAALSFEDAEPICIWKVIAEEKNL